MRRLLHPDIYEQRRAEARRKQALGDAAFIVCAVAALVVLVGPLVFMFTR